MSPERKWPLGNRMYVETSTDFVSISSSVLWNKFTVKILGICTLQRHDCVLLFEFGAVHKLLSSIYDIRYTLLYDGSSMV